MYRLYKTMIFSMLQSNMILLFDISDEIFALFDNNHNLLNNYYQMVYARVYSHYGDGGVGIVLQIH